MSAPVPAPRLSKLSDKRPVPTPRRTIPIRLEEENVEEPISERKIDTSSTNSGREMEINSNTFTRRVKTISTASKQIAEDIGGKVQEGKKIVIEGTRQSVRRLTRRFHNTQSLCDMKIGDNAKVKDDEEMVSEAELDLFNSIKFNSPINNNFEKLYVNDDCSSEENLNLPPPTYPPPPLREEASFYDEPQSLASGSTSSTKSSDILPSTNRMDYESVFPLYPYNTNDNNNDKNDSGTSKASSVQLSRSSSWNFYDPLPKSENLYNNVDNTPTLNTTHNDEDNNNIDGSESDRYSLSIIRTNSIYENHELHKRATHSVLMQFDPLKDGTEVPPISMLNDLKALEELLQGDLYNNITDNNTYDNWSISNESDFELEYANPPTPPTRYDSLPAQGTDIPINNNTTINESHVMQNNATINKDDQIKSKSQFFVNQEFTQQPTTTKVEDSKAFKWLKKTQEVLRKAPDIIARSVRNKDHYIQRPSLIPKNNLPQKGMLYKITTVENLFGEYGARWCVLEGNNLFCYYDNSCDNIKENFNMNSILSIQIIIDQKYKYKYENEDLYCFEINAPPGVRGGHIYGSKSSSERRVWMQRIAENLTNKFSPKLTSDYTRMGWAYVREGVSGEWIGAWIILCQRTLYYTTDTYGSKSIDLRKARFIGIQVPQDSEFVPRTQDKGPNMLLDYATGSLYLRMWTSRETKVWCHVVKIAAHNNGANLDNQQLTKNDVPVIVEKCINFIYVYGSMSEGIYRRPGTGTVINDILTAFRKDAWSVQLTRDKYTEHDIATALKRFFRDLPEPLLTINKRQYLYQVSKVKNKEEKVRMYKAVFDQSPTIAQNTIRKLFGHLYFITSQHVKNKMNTENISAIWGPTLMHFEDNHDPQEDSLVVSQIIQLYPYIFPENAKEAEQEKLMLQVLEKHFQSPQGSVNNKTTGDFRVWVYLNNKQGRTFNIAIGPKKTAYDVCCEISNKIKTPVHELQLEEYVLNYNLVRPIHHAEKVLDVVLKWSYWEESDRKENCLILSQLSKYWEYIQDKPLPVSGELRYADSKTKNFKPYTFEFAQSKLNYYKDKSCTQLLGTWNIEDITWYFGHESKRNPSTKWSVTFIPKCDTVHRSKNSPYFGNVIVWNDPAARAVWLAAMLKAEHPNDLKPPPQIVNLMSY